MQQFHVNTEKGTLTSCTHPNGHHNSKQSCPKTSRLNECMISVWYVLCILLQMHSIYHINIFHHHMKNGFIFNPCTGRQRISNSSQMKVTKMLLIVSSVFVLLNLPSYVLRVISFLWVNYSLWICCCYCRKKYYCILHIMNILLLLRCRIQLILSLCGNTSLNNFSLQISVSILFYTVWADKISGEQFRWVVCVRYAQFIAYWYV